MTGDDDRDERGAPRREVTPDELRGSAEELFQAQTAGAVSEILRGPGDVLLGLVATGLGVRRLAVIRKPPRSRDYGGLCVLQSVDVSPTGKLYPTGAAILLNGRAISHLASAIADVIDLEMEYAQRIQRAQSSRAGGQAAGARETNGAGHPASSPVTSDARPGPAFDGQKRE